MSTEGHIWLQIVANLPLLFNLLLMGGMFVQAKQLFSYLGITIVISKIQTLKSRLQLLFFSTVHKTIIYAVAKLIEDGKNTFPYK